MRIKNNKGITLIALVITIIVLLILAGVTISMVLGDDGIIRQAEEAKQKSEDSSKEDAISVAKGEAAIAGYSKQEGLDINNEKMATIKSKIAAYNDGKTEATQYKYENTVAKITEEGVPIPVGFAYVEGTKKDTGLIVVDGYGNEYVWVPVDGTNVQLELDDTYGGWTGEETTTGLDTTIVPAGTIETERAAMATSVSLYGGFFVGRYETSWTGSRVASVANETSMSGSTQVGESRANWYTFYNKQKELHKNSSSVVSGMIYGSQWDAIMDWMKEVPNPKGEMSEFYIFDSTEMGCYENYVDCTECHGEEGYNWDCEICEGYGRYFQPIKTGSNSAYSVKNIFDLAGNYFEWTQEAYDAYDRVGRGGSCGNVGSRGPASYRGVYPADALDLSSSRLQLYIK